MLALQRKGERRGKIKAMLKRMVSDQGCPGSSSAAAAGGGGDRPRVGAGMSVPCSRFFRGDLKSGPETAAAGAHSSNGKRHSFDLGKLPGPGPLSLPAPTIAGGGPRRFVASVSASEVEQSEDYTCIIARGPNPKTTHIFGDCILEPQAVAKSGVAMEVEQGAAKYSSYLVVKCAAAEDGAPAAAEDFLSSCFACRKKLEGNDIYIYRGEKAFCSASCRDQQILIDEEAENNTTTIGSPGSSCSSMQEDIFFMAGMIVAT